MNKEFIESERVNFESYFNIDVSKEWDSEDQYYDSDVGHVVISMWNAWIARAELGQQKR